MAISEKDYRRFVDLIAMSDSANDAEALLYLRKALSILKANQMTLKEMLLKPFEIDREPGPRPPPPPQWQSYRQQQTYQRYDSDFDLNELNALWEALRRNHAHEAAMDEMKRQWKHRR